MLIDIFYSEINKWRDKQLSEQEKMSTTKEALKKVLAKFKFLWDDQILTGIYKRNEINPLFASLSEDFLTLAVEVGSILKDEVITDYLRNMSTNFRKASRYPNVMGGFFQNPVPSEIEDNLKIIEQINERINQ